MVRVERVTAKTDYPCYSQATHQLVDQLLDEGGGQSLTRVQVHGKDHLT